MKNQLVIFDMDGTLLDTLDDIYTSLNYALAKNSIETKSKEEVKSLLGFGIKALTQTALDANLDKAVVACVLNDFLSHYKEHSCDCTAAYDGILEVLSELKKSGFKLAINSNKPDMQTKQLANRFFDGIFDVVLGQRSDFEPKPSSDGVKLICKELNTEPESTIYIGDSDIDFYTAKNSNTEFIACAYGFKGEKFLQNLGAKHIAKEPLDIINIIKIIS